ncbi:MAG: RagB/SusD family nutrient uptake outer membrane protein [Bacteroidales bacterium]
MKKIINLVLILAFAVQFSSCIDWLEVLPENTQPSDSYWQTKEELEATVVSGYIYARKTVEDCMKWGEMRGSDIYTTNSSYAAFQKFQVKPEDTKLCSWAGLYAVINLANTVIDNADKVMANDVTLTEGAKNAYLTEMYFLRAFSYFNIYRNWEAAPLVTTPYESDVIEFKQPAVSRNEIKAQIISDLKTALATGSAKEKYDGDEWKTKGRATKWALYALLADVYLWDENYQGVIDVCDKITNATSAFRPVFVKNASRWVEIFNPGNSTGSIFELNYNTSQRNPLCSYFGLSGTYYFTPEMNDAMILETTEAGGPATSIRSMYGAWNTTLGDVDYAKATVGAVWKYSMAEERAGTTTRPYADTNFMVYRMAEILLMKAEALVMLGDYNSAMELINRVRVRVNLEEIVYTEQSELEMLKLVLSEKRMEFAAEGKRWYDLLRFGMRNDYQYRSEFISEIAQNNSSAKESWIRTVLSNDHALFLPISETEIQNNDLLQQNPYYDATN